MEKQQPKQDVKLMPDVMQKLKLYKVKGNFKTYSDAIEEAIK
jgi:hypothetical protein